MALTPVRCAVERFGKAGEGHRFYPGPIVCGGDVLPGPVQMAVADRPVGLKDRFLWKAGADDWMTGRSSLAIPVHSIRNDGVEESLSRLAEDFRISHGLLTETGVLYAFSGQAESARVRLLLDEVFGRSNFLNEIIWAQPAGLKPQGRFTRSHQTIFLYRKGKKAYFNASAAGRARGRLKSHMRREEEGGRAYYTQEARGKVYRYYEDDLVSIGDVWSDIPEISARDEERTGWEGQRPEALLSRMIAASTAPGHMVLDLSCGGATVAAATQTLGRRVLAVGSHPSERLLARRRLLLAGAQNIELLGSCGQSDIQPEAAASLADGMAFLELYHRSASHPKSAGTLLEDGLGSLEYWAAGRYADGVFTVNSWAMRTRQQPNLAKQLPVGDGFGKPCIHLVDASGEQWFYIID